jgi:tRNA threonylcarbamoyladenosine biosynthesis protein TsaE
MDILTQSTKETQNLGHKIGASLVGGEVIALTGNLGAGKTTFVQGIAQGLGINDRVTSPTFILMRSYSNQTLTLYHLDMYRLEDNFDEEVRNLGLKDIWGKPDTIVIIEWAEKIKHLLPVNTRYIKTWEKTKESFHLHEVIYRYH